MSYVEKQEQWLRENDVKPGDLLIATRKAKSYEDGWKNLWVPSMGGRLKEPLMFRREVRNSGLELRDGLKYPYFILEKVEVDPSRFKEGSYVFVSKKTAINRGLGEEYYNRVGEIVSKNDDGVTLRFLHNDITRNIHMWRFEKPADPSSKSNVAERKTMRDEYIEKQEQWLEHNDIKPGDLLIATRRPENYESGWDNNWIESMDRTLKAPLVFKRHLLSAGLLLSDGRRYPYFVLEKVQTDPSKFREGSYIFVSDEILKERGLVVAEHGNVAKIGTVGSVGYWLKFCKNSKTVNILKKRFEKPAEPVVKYSEPKPGLIKAEWDGGVMYAVESAWIINPLGRAEWVAAKIDNEIYGDVKGEFKEIPAELRYGHPDGWTGVYQNAYKTFQKRLPTTEPEFKRGDLVEVGAWEGEAEPEFHVGDLVKVIPWEGQVDGWLWLDVKANYFNKPRKIKAISSYKDRLYADFNKTGCAVPFSQLQHVEKPKKAEPQTQIKVGDTAVVRFTQTTIGDTATVRFTQKAKTQYTYSGTAILEDGREWIIPEPDKRRGWVLDNVCKRPDSWIGNGHVTHKEGKCFLAEARYMTDTTGIDHCEIIKTWKRPSNWEYNPHANKHPDIQTALKKWPPTW